MEFLDSLRMIFLIAWRALSHLHSSSEWKVGQYFEKEFDQEIKEEQRSEDNSQKGLKKDLKGFRECNRK